MLCDYFKFNGFDFFKETYGLEAIEKFDDSVDIVILDVMLLKIDWLNVLRKIRKK